MNKAVSFIFGNDRVTSILGYVLGLPAVYDAFQTLASGGQVNFRTLAGGIGLAILGRLTNECKAVAVAAPVAQ